VYRRNQVEWAIWQVLDRGNLTSTKPPQQVVHTIRRLIDVDRALGTERRAYEPWKRQFAFVEGTPQGRGGENQYQLAEAVALWIGVQFLAAGLPQTEIVQFLRALKDQLKHQVGKIHAPYAKRIEAARKEGGDLARQLRTTEVLPPEQHVYLLTEQVAAHGVLTAATASGRSKVGNICCGRADLLEFIETYVSRSKRLVAVEIANALLSLAYFLAIAPSVRRGRPT
jgi:hypothetical protein